MYITLTESGGNAVSIIISQISYIKQNISADYTTQIYLSSADRIVYVKEPHEIVLEKLRAAWHR